MESNLQRKAHLSKATEALKVIPKSALAYCHETSNVVFTLRQWNTVRKIYLGQDIFSPPAQLCYTKKFSTDRLMLQTKKFKIVYHEAWLLLPWILYLLRLPCWKYRHFEFSHGKHLTITSTVWDHHKKLTKKQQKQKPVHLWEKNICTLELDTMGETCTLHFKTTAELE